LITCGVTAGEVKNTSREGIYVSGGPEDWYKEELFKPMSWRFGVA
jgi:hypothetical protein